MAIDSRDPDQLITMLEEVIDDCCNAEAELNMAEVTLSGEWPGSIYTLLAAAEVAHGLEWLQWAREINETVT